MTEKTLEHRLRRSLFSTPPPIQETEQTRSPVTPQMMHRLQLAFSLEEVEAIVHTMELQALNAKDLRTLVEIVARHLDATDTTLPSTILQRVNDHIDATTTLLTTLIQQVSAIQTAMTLTQENALLERDVLTKLQGRL